MRYLNYLLSLFLSFLLVTPSFGQRTNGTIDLAVDYGLNWQQDKTLADLGYTYAQAKTEFPAWVGWCEYQGWAQSEVLSLYKIVCCWNDAAWKTDTYLGTGWYYQDGCQSRGNIDCPDGGYRVNYSLITAYGHYTGKGANPYYESSEQSNPGCTPGTALRVDHNKWLKTRCPDRILLKSTHWGDNGLLGYAQGTVIKDFFLEGMCADKYYDASFHSSGIGLWDAGEASSIYNCYAFGFNDFGFEIVKGTPALVVGCSSFANCLGGFGLLGGSGLHTCTFIDPSGDDNPALFRMRKLPDGVGGGTITIIGAKSEGGKRTPYRGQILVDADGAYNIIVDGAWVAIDYRLAHALFVLKGLGSCQLDVRGLKYYGCANLVQDISAGKVYSGGGQYAPISFTINETGVYNATRTITSTSCGCTERLGLQEWVGSTLSPAYNYTNCTPKYNYTGTTTPTTPPPTITSFSSTPSSLSGSGEVTLSWNTTDAKSVSISGVTGALPTSGTTKVTISSTTTFTLTATGDGGNSTKAIAVTVTTPTTPAPTVTSFTANPSNLTGSGQTVLSWQTTNATKVDIAGGSIPANQPANGSYTTTVSSNTTFTLTATGTGGTAVKSVDVSVTTTPSTDSEIDPNSVLVVVNSNDPASSGIASAYMTAWGIPSSNLRTMNLGNADVCSQSTLTNERSKLNASSSHQYIALCFSKPSRVGNVGINSTAQSITSAMTFGNRSVSSLTASAVFNYSGVKPFTDKGVRPSWIVLATNHIKKSAHGARPNGMMYAIASKDQNPPIRGNCRVSQFAAMDSRPNFEYIDIRNVGNEIGYGENPYQTPRNWAFEKYELLWAQYNAGNYPTSDPRKTKFSKKPLAAAFLSMYKWGGLEEMDLQPGWYSDVVTSFAGYLPDGAGQTPILYQLNLGASMATGLVSEPGSARTSEFVDVTKFVPLWQDQRKPNAVAVWGSVQCPDRLLIAGDGMCAPFR